MSLLVINNLLYKFLPSDNNEKWRSLVKARVVVML